MDVSEKHIATLQTLLLFLLIKTLEWGLCGLQPLLTNCKQNWISWRMCCWNFNTTVFETKTRT